MRRLAGVGLVVVGALGIVVLLPAAPVKAMPGAAVFADKGCMQCHGRNGEGTNKGPNLRGVGRRLTRAQIETQIREGGQQMPAFGEVLEGAEIDQLAEYLGTWKAKSVGEK